MKDHICTAIREGDYPLRCWKRANHVGQHMAALPNVDREIVTKPLIARW